MKYACYVLFACLMLVLSTPSLRAQAGDEATLKAQVETLRKAMVDADKPTLEKLAADKLSYGHSSGKIEDKAAFVEAIVSGKSDFIAIDVSDVTINIAGNTAIVRHKLTGDVANDGVPGKVNLGILLVWQKEKGTWRLLARQAFKL